MKNAPQLPFPHPNNAGRNLQESRPAESFEKRAKLWRPKDVPNENLTATASRFALQLIDRTTGRAYSADELVDQFGGNVDNSAINEAIAEDPESARQALGTVITIGPLGGYLGGNRDGNARNAGTLEIQSAREAFAGIPESADPYYPEVPALTANEHVATGENSILYGSSCAATTENSVAIGNKVRVFGQNTIGFGQNIVVAQSFSSAFGYNSQALGNSSNACGLGCEATGDDSTAIGYYCFARGVDSCAIGTDCTALGQFSSCYGDTSTAGGSHSTVLGLQCYVYGYGSMALGYYTEQYTDKTLEIGYTETLGSARSSAVRLHNNGMVAMTIQDRATAYTDASDTQAVTITQTGGIATVSLNSHGYNVGSKVTISGAAQAGYNITAQVLTASANSFTIAVNSGTVSPATGSPVVRAAKGSERNNELAQGMFAMRRNGDQLLIDVNIGGTIKTLSLGTAT
jgi:hypothetical protein